METLVRIVVLVVGLVTLPGLAFLGITLSVADDVGSALAGDDERSGTLIALVIPLVWLFGCGFVLTYPRIAAALFGAVAAIGVVGSLASVGLLVWPLPAVVLAALALGGSTETRRAAREQGERDALLRELVQLVRAAGEEPAPAPPLATPCPKCGAPVAPTDAYCPRCGFTFLPSPRLPVR